MGGGRAPGNQDLLIPTLPLTSSFQCALSAKQMELTTASWMDQTFLSSMPLYVIDLGLHVFVQIPTIPSSLSSKFICSLKLPALP